MVATAEILEFDATGHQRFAPRVLIQSDSYTVGTTDNDDTVTSASFTADDVGRGVFGQGIAAGTTIASVVPGVSADLSQAVIGTGTITLYLDPGAIGAGNLWLQEVGDPEGGSDVFGVLRARNANDDGWDNAALAAVDSSGNILSITSEGALGYVSMYVRRPDLSYIGWVRIGGGQLSVATLDDAYTISLSASDTMGGNESHITLSPAGIALQGAAITANGTPIP